MVVTANVAATTTVVAMSSCRMEQGSAPQTEIDTGNVTSHTTVPTNRIHPVVSSTT